MERFKSVNSSQMRFSKKLRKNSKVVNKKMGGQKLRLAEKAIITKKPIWVDRHWFIKEGVNLKKEYKVVKRIG